MNQLKQQQAALIQELETLEESLPQLEAEWRNSPSGFSANGNVIGSPESREAMENLSSVKARIDAIPGELASIDRKLQHLDRLEKIGQIKADAIQAMTDATAEVEALERKKVHLSERFQTIQSEADQALEKAQQAERDAATSYAKSLASGDAEGEKSASGEMQKAAKQLATTDEHVRRQDLILGALQVELDTLETQITNACQRVDEAKAAALSAVGFALNEEWNAATEQLLAVGARILAVSYLKGGMGDALSRLEVPRFGPFHSGLNRSNLAAVARNISLEELLAA
jgi:flagellin-like hook-associated protein FlgL